MHMHPTDSLTDRPIGIPREFSIVWLPAPLFTDGAGMAWHNTAINGQ